MPWSRSSPPSNRPNSQRRKFEASGVCAALIPFNDTSRVIDAARVVCTCCKGCPRCKTGEGEASAIFQRSSVTSLEMPSVTVLLFASYAEAIGHDRLSVALPDGATAADALAHVRGLVAVDALPEAPMLAVNARYAQSAQRLEAGDELAIIPPVAGG